MSEPITRVENALRSYILAQSRMLDGWSEGNAKVKKALWQNLHDCETEGREALEDVGILVATGERIGVRK